MIFKLAIFGMERSFVPTKLKRSTIDLCSLLGTSGQNLDDIDLQSTIDNRVQILENCLKWNVIAPTCPDTLSKTSSFDFPIRSPEIGSGCYPYVKNDPFIITETPHVFFAGNQPQFETHLHQGQLTFFFLHIFSSHETFSRTQ